MNRLVEGLEEVSLAAILAAISAMAVVMLFVPERLRRDVALLAIPVLLTVARLRDLGSIATLAKLITPMVFVVVAITAAWRQGNQARIATKCWVLPLVAATSILCVWGCEDRELAIAIRVGWLILMIAALMTVRTIDSEASLEVVIWSLFVGMGVASTLALTSLLIEPQNSFQGGFGRFTPYGCNPNQIGVMFAACAALGLYFILAAQSLASRLVALSFTAIALGCLLLTVSRGSLLIFLLPAGPSLIGVLRRPAFAMFAIVMLSLGVYVMLSTTQEASYERVGTGVDTRWDHTSRVLEEVQLRPLLGLAGTSGTRAVDADDNAHNAYVEMLYVGGAVMCVPLFWIQLCGIYSAVQVLRLRFMAGARGRLPQVLAGLLAAICLHGFVNELMYYPTYTIAFMNVMLTTWFVSCHRHMLVAMRSHQRFRQRRPQMTAQLRPAGSK